MGKVFLIFLATVFLSWDIGASLKLKKATRRIIFLVCLLTWIIVVHVVPTGSVRAYGIAICAGLTIGWRCGFPSYKDTSICGDAVETGREN